MRRSTLKEVSCAALAGCALSWFVLLASAAPARAVPGELLEFAAEMARRGNWREARFRWEEAARLEPNNPRVLNNLAVAAEALGDFELARASYEKAASAGNDRRILDNRSRFELFRRRTSAAGATDPAAPAPVAPRGGKSKAGADSIRVTVKLPVPARLAVAPEDRLLVASFLGTDPGALDVKGELVRYVRSELRKASALDVLEVVPPPAVPEQTLDDLIANDQFWKYLGREYDADLIVTGVVQFDRQDYSGFRDVDVVSSQTGQKVRRSQFVEQEKFVFSVDIMFMDGATGELRLRDRLQRSAVFPGSQNDPITAFFEMSESLRADLLAIVRPRTWEDVRVIFRS